MIDAYVSLGSNLGDRMANVAAAVAELAALPDTKLIAVSHAYESEPWGVDTQDAFVNAVAHIRTDVYADQLLALLKDAEERLGRKPTTRFGPRTIDLDILLFGDEEWASEALTIPHPRMALRDFVMRPLLEIAPELRYPNGDFVTDEAAAQGKVLADLGPIPGWEASTPARAGEEGELRATGPDEEWVQVGPTRTEWGNNTNADFDVLFFETVLRGAGIPCRFYPHRPNEGTWRYAIPDDVQLLVPTSRKAEAERVIAEAISVPPSPVDFDA